VFRTNSIPIIWDGKLNGKEMQPGVYVYVVKFDQETDMRILSGNLTLVR